MVIVRETGAILVKAKLHNLHASARITVVSENQDDEINTINIFRVLPDGHVLPSRKIKEG